VTPIHLFDKLQFSTASSPWPPVALADSLITVGRAFWRKRGSRWIPHFRCWMVASKCGWQGVWLSWC